MDLCFCPLKEVSSKMKAASEKKRKLLTFDVLVKLSREEIVTLSRAGPPDEIVEFSRAGPPSVSVLKKGFVKIHEIDGTLMDVVKENGFVKIKIRALKDCGGMYVEKTERNESGIVQTINISEQMSLQLLWL